MIATRCLLEGLDATKGKEGLLWRLIDDTHALPVDGLHKALGSEKRQRLAHGIMRTAKCFDERVL